MKRIKDLSVDAFLSRLLIMLCFVYCSNAIYAQSPETIDVSGHVKDTSGDPLIGVTVQCEGKSSGTISDLDGFYKINKVRKG